MLNFLQSLRAQACRFRTTSSSVKPSRHCAPHAEFAALGSTWRQRSATSPAPPIPVLGPAGSLANVTRVTPDTPIDPAPPTPESGYIAHRQTPQIGLMYDADHSPDDERAVLYAPTSNATRPARRRSILPPVMLLARPI